MQIVVCPDKFASTLSASQAAIAISEGWHRFAPDASIQIIPVSDGGTGFLDSISTALSLKREPLIVRGALGANIPAEYAFDYSSAYIEVAQIVGIDLIEPSNQTSIIASSYGAGQAIKAAVEKGFKKIILGLGGTSVSDGGAGMFAALGAKVFDESGFETDALEYGASKLLEVSKIDLEEITELLNEVTIEILTDVDNPLLGARGTAQVFATQKGASDKQILEIESALTHFSKLLGKREDGKNPAVALGAGAAGGIGFGLIRLGASRSAGIDRVMNILGLKQAIEKADLVITGEGKFDWQSLDGKAVTGVARMAMNLGKPTIVLAGQVEIGRRDWQTIGVNGAFALAEFAGLERAMSDPAQVLSELAQRVARTWNR